MSRGTAEPDSLRGSHPVLQGTADGWTTVITPQRSWFDWRLRLLWRFRELIVIFVWRDYVSAYKQTILGPAWHVIQPLLTTLTLTVVFGKVAGLSTGGVPPFLFYLSGTVLWGYFANTLTRTANTFVANAPLLGKVYFHRLVIPVSIALSSLITLAIQLGIFAAFLAFYLAIEPSVHMTRAALLFPLLIVILAGYALGLGIVVSALTTRYRDLANLLTFGVQLFMFATPVIYPVSSVPPRFRLLVALNPLSPVLESFRAGFIGTGMFGGAELAVSAAGMVLLLAAGLMLFTRVERTFMDTV